MPGPETLFWPESFAAWAEAIRNAGLVVGGIAAFGVAAWALHLNRLRTKNDSKRLDNEAERLRQQAQALENDRHRLVNDTYVKAIEQLGHEKMEVRLGAIYALERIARDADDFELYWSIMETLCAYVRERPASRWGKKANGRNDREQDSAAAASTIEQAQIVGLSPRWLPPGDVAAVFTVMKRRSETRKVQESEADLRLDLRNVDLANADLRDINLDHANLEGAILSGAELRRASFANAIMRDAHLTGAYLWSARLTETNLRNAKLQHANLRRVVLKNAKLGAADFTDAKLWKADLCGAEIREAKFSGADLKEARFSGSPCDLGAVWDKTNPPDGIKEIRIVTD